MLTVELITIIAVIWYQANWEKDREYDNAYGTW